MTCQWNRTEGYHYHEGSVYKLKEACFIPTSLKEAFAFLTQNYSWKVPLRKFHSVFSEIKKEN